MVHLRRDFQAMIDRGGDGEKIGRRLLSLSNRLFRHWHRVRDGTLEWSSFQERMSRLRREVEQALREGSRCPCAEDGGDVLRDPQGGGGPVGVRAGQGGRADEQRGGTCVAARGDLASDQWWDRQRATGADSWSEC